MSVARYAHTAERPEVGEMIFYLGATGHLASGYLVEHATSPLSGTDRYRVVDFWSEVKNPGAGRWIGHDKVRFILESEWPMPRFHPPRNPHVLETWELIEIVERIQELLWLQGETWNAHKPCDDTELVDDIVELLQCHNLQPTPKE